MTWGFVDATTTIALSSGSQAAHYQHEGARGSRRFGWHAFPQVDAPTSTCSPGPKLASRSKAHSRPRVVGPQRNQPTAPSAAAKVVPGESPVAAMTACLMHNQALELSFSFRELGMALSRYGHATSRSAVVY